MQSEDKQPAGIFLSLFLKAILSLLVICISMALFDPFFVAYKARNIELAIIAILIIPIFTQTKVRRDPELYAKRRMELQNPSFKKTRSIGQIIGGLVLIIGFIFLLIKSIQVNIANHIPEFQSMATPAMQKECEKNCSAYGVTLSSLIGPTTEESYCCTGKSGHINFLFSWHSNKPDVTLKVRIHKQDNRYPLTIEPYWIGNPISDNVMSNASIQEPAKRTRDDVQSVTQKNKMIIDAAYHHALKVTPSMHGSYMAMQLTIEPDGHVSNVQVISTDLNSTNLKNNLLNIFRNLKFSSGNFSIMNLTYRLNL